MPFAPFVAMLFAPSSVLVTTSKALVTRSDALVTSSVLHPTSFVCSDEQRSELWTSPESSVVLL